MRNTIDYKQKNSTWFQFKIQPDYVNKILHYVVIPAL